MSRLEKEKHGRLRTWLFSFMIAAEINMVDQNHWHNLLKISIEIFVLITGSKCANSKTQRCILHTFKSDTSCQLLKSDFFSFLSGKNNQGYTLGLLVYICIKSVVCIIYMLIITNDFYIVVNMFITINMRNKKACSESL